jgi:hypothetical protein
MPPNYQELFKIQLYPCAVLESQCRLHIADFGGKKYFNCCPRKHLRIFFVTVQEHFILYCRRTEVVSYSGSCLHRTARYGLATTCRTAFFADQPRLGGGGGSHKFMNYFRGLCYHEVREPLAWAMVYALKNARCLV